MRKIACIVLLVPIILQGHRLYGQACPNGDFENWKVTNFTRPDSLWLTSNPQSLALADSLTVWSTSGFSGQAVHMQTAIVNNDTLQAFISNTSSHPQSGRGGLPYTQQPTNITGYYRYNLPANDSAVLIAIFKKAGVIISNNVFKIRNASGSMPTFTPFNLTLASIPVVPDSVIIAAASSNILGTGAESGSWLELDQLAFTGPAITQGIPGGYFDSWLTDSSVTPMIWHIRLVGPAGIGVSRSMEHCSGNYSMELISQGLDGSPFQGFYCRYASPHHAANGTGTQCGLAFSQVMDTLSGCYMYIPAGNDTGSLNVSFCAGGSPAGVAQYDFSPVGVWTNFELPVLATTTPDSIKIQFFPTVLASQPPGTASSLLLDHLELRSEPLNAKKNQGQHNSLLVYPNPTDDILNIVLTGDEKGKVDLRVYDLIGRVLKRSSYESAPDRLNIFVQDLAVGIYYYELENNGNTLRGKFIKR